MNKHKIYSAFVKVLADTITPVGAYLKMRDHYPNALLLESSDYHSKEDSFSFICLQPMAGFEASERKYSISNLDGSSDHFEVDSMTEMSEVFKSFLSQFEEAENENPTGICGLFGYTSFEAVQYFEDIKLAPKSDAHKDNPDMKYQFFRYVLAIDHFKNQLYILKYGTSPLDSDDPDFKKLYSQLKIARTEQFKFSKAGDESSNLTDQQYEDAVARGTEHCRRGDVFQVVLSREFKQGFKGDEFNVYRSIRSINPSPYLFYFDYGNFKLFGSSPELQISVRDNQAVIAPIAGTVKRTGNAQDDLRLAKEMRENPKEISEHIMLVDLARNDLSRSAEKVKVDTYAETQYYSHVIHMVSKVTGALLEGKSSLDLYFNTFPAGTLSGAPKYRALQIIDENEPSKRNFYGGAIGYFGFDGSVNHAIVIRSILSKNNTLTYQAGAGIVVGSTPQGERKEIDNKVAAIRRAIISAVEI
ncbi:MAG: anthranilate synthase component I family protein [Flavobacteriales bacterium]|nr:anthranilate synthase component I family protein [Flavobacteriales bacterium]